MENKVNKNSIMEDAVIELQSIVEAADKKAIERMKKTLPKEFESLLKEELNNIKKESVKESVKDNKKEPVSEGKKTDNNKESLNEMEEIDLSELSLEDIEEAYNEASSTDEFEISPDEINIDDVEKELEEMQSMNSDIDDMQEEGDNSNDPFDQIKNLHKMLGEMIQDNQMTTEMHNKVPHGATAPVSSGHNTTPSGINEDFMGVDPEMIASIVSLLAVAGTAAIEPMMAKLRKVKPEIAAAIEGVAKGASQGAAKGAGSLPGMGEGLESEIVDETAGSQKGHAINRTVGNENMPTSSPRKNSTQRQFQQEGVKTWSNESVQKFLAQKETMEKRMSSLINENKKMTKKLNESKEKASKFEGIIAEHSKIKQTLVKYRDQLSEMAIFNTNLAGVNSILVNENLALTNEDKKQIINKFKNVKSINESENTYKAVVAEMQKAKKTITESVKDKVTTNIDKSSSEKVVEQTAYVNEHVSKIKDMMKYVDGHGNKKILR